MFPSPIQKLSFKINITYKILLVFTLLLWLLPLIAVLMTSMRSNGDILRGNYWGMPTEFALIENYTKVFSVSNLGRYFLNSLIITLPTVLGTIQLATFVNQAGLQAIGNNAFIETDASGAPTVGNPNSDDRGKTQQGALEMSNVSVVEEMVNLISAQRAYETNSRTVQTSDEMLQTANNMKR